MFSNFRIAPLSSTLCALTLAMVLVNPASTADAKVEGDATATSGYSSDLIEGPELADIFDEFATDPAIKQIIDSAVALMLEEGEHEPGWEKSGVDMLAEIESSEHNNGLLYEADEDIPSIYSLTGTEFAIPESYFVYQLDEEKAARHDESVIMGIGDAVWLKMEYPRTQKGNALCYPSAPSMTLYSREPVDEWGDETFGFAGMMYGIAQSLQGVELCSIYKKTENGAFVGRTYSPDGIRFPNIDADSGALKFVSAEKMAALLAAGEE